MKSPPDVPSLEQLHAIVFFQNWRTDAKLYQALFPNEADLKIRYKENKCHCHKRELKTDVFYLKAVIHDLENVTFA